MSEKVYTIEEIKKLINDIFKNIQVWYNRENIG